MAVNITFWYLPEDEKEFLDFIKKDERVVALPFENTTPVAKSELSTPDQLIQRENCAQMFLTLNSLLEEVKWVGYESEGKKLYGIDAVNSPVISFSRSVFRGENKLGQAAISAQLEKLTKNRKNLVDQKEEFISWVNKVFTFVRKSTPEFHQYKSYRISKRVIEAKQYGLDLVF